MGDIPDGDGTAEVEYGGKLRNLPFEQVGAAGFDQCQDIYNYVYNCILWVCNRQSLFDDGNLDTNQLFLFCIYQILVLI